MAKQVLSDLERRVLKTLRSKKLKEGELAVLIDTLKQSTPPVPSKTNYVMPNTTVLRLFHPGKGTAYALSYHPQKWADSLADTNKPSLVGMGHYHKIEQLFYNNIHMFQTGTMEEQTPFMRRMNIAAHLGAWIIWIDHEDPIGLLGDTHVGSKFYREDLLDRFYKIAHEEGVQNFYHTGDMVAGENMYRGQVYDLSAHGLDNQVEEVVKRYPKIKGTKTFFITGNHDLSFWKTTGVDIGRRIAERRKDLVYLGQEEANVTLKKSKFKELVTMLIPFYT